MPYSRKLKKQKKAAYAAAPYAAPYAAPAVVCSPLLLYAVFFTNVVLREPALPIFPAWVACAPLWPAAPMESVWIRITVTQNED